MRDKEVTYKIMAAIKSKNTIPEILLGKALWHKGIRYRKHYNIIGKPDFAIVSKRVAIFCDGDFWHGNNWKIRGLENLEQELSRYSLYWRNKILNNIKRDEKVTNILIFKGWVVIRVWESDVINNTEQVAEQIINKIKTKT